MGLGFSRRDPSSEVWFLQKGVGFSFEFSGLLFVKLKGTRLEPLSNSRSASSLIGGFGLATGVVTDCYTEATGSKGREWLPEA